MIKKMIVSVFLVLGFISVSFIAHAGIYQAMIEIESDDYFQVYWGYDDNGDDVNVQTGSIWQGSIWIDDNGSTFDVTWGFSKYGESLFISDPMTLAKTAGDWVFDYGLIDIDGFYHQHELDAHPHEGWSHFTLIVANTGVVVPEPISSTLFIIGGVTLGFRRFRRKFKK